ncbi:MAG: SdpI family protein [Flavobacteriaceae bacterium]
MNIDIIQFNMPLLIGSVFLITGFIMLKFPPKKINSLYGYRTKSSMKSQNRWNFAQNYSAKLMIYCGLLLGIIGLIGSYFDFFKGAKSVIISALISFIIIGFLFFKTEKAIKQIFLNEN